MYSLLRCFTEYSKFLRSASNAHCMFDMLPVASYFMFTAFPTSLSNTPTASLPASSICWLVSLILFHRYMLLFWAWVPVELINSEGRFCGHLLWYISCESAVATHPVGILTSLALGVCILKGISWFHVQDKRGLIGFFTCNFNFENPSLLQR